MLELDILDKKKRGGRCVPKNLKPTRWHVGRWHVCYEPGYSPHLLRPGGLPSEGFRLHGELGAGSKKLDEQRTSLEKKFNQLDLDIDMVVMDVESSNNQVTTRSSEKATTKQPLKDVEREKAYFEVQVDAFGRESEVKTKEVAKIINEVRVAVQGSDGAGARREGQALALLGRIGAQD